MTPAERQAARARCEAAFRLDHPADLPAALDEIDALRELVRGWAERLEAHYVVPVDVVAEMRAALEGE